MHKAITAAQRAQAQRAMTLAMARGVDPRDSHRVMDRKWADCARMAALRCRSEADANRWLERYGEGERR